MLKDDITTKLAQLVAAIDTADTDKLVMFKTTPRDLDAIVVSIPEKLVNDSGFNRKILELGVIPSRLTSSKKSNNKNLNSSRYIYSSISSLETVDIQELEDAVNEFTDKLLKELTAKQIAGLVLLVYRHWLKLPGGLKTHRSVNEKMVRGYLKQREQYTHDEIINALTVYGKWAQAKEKALKDGDIDSFWFHRWDLDQLLISNKSMNHLDGGWWELIKSKGIPSEYAGQTEKPKDEPSAKEQKERRAQMFTYIANDIIKYGTPGAAQTQIYRDHQVEIDALVEKLKKEESNAS